MDLSIIELRKNAYKLDAPLIVLLIAGLASSYFSQVVAGAFGIACFAYFYSKVRRAAHAPCPRCGEPYGSSWKYPIGVGSDYCQSCQLPLHQT